MNSADLSENDRFSEITEEEVDIKNLFKIVFLGNSGVGKTNIMNRFTTNNFNMHSKPTIGVDFGIKTINVDDTFVKLQLWDTAGQERYKTYTSAYFKDALGLIIVYDITDIDSFKSVQKWLDVAKENVDLNLCSILLFGNKLDLEESRHVTLVEAEEFSAKNELLFSEVSAFEDKSSNIPKCIRFLVKSKIKRHYEKAKHSRFIGSNKYTKS